MKHLLVASMLVALFAGCGPKQEWLFLPQKCNAERVAEPQWSDESTNDRVLYLRAVLENSGKHRSYEYDLKAQLEKCL